MILFKEIVRLSFVRLPFPSGRRIANGCMTFVILCGILVFTPLFLGAELHVPTGDDIGTPGRLAEWMAESQVTATHLTPG